MLWNMYLLFHFPKSKVFQTQFLHIADKELQPRPVDAVVYSLAGNCVRMTDSWNDFRHTDHSRHWNANADEYS